VPRFDLPSKQADGTPNYVDVKEADDFLAADLFAIHRAVRVSTGGDATYSPREVDDDMVNAFLGKAITAWSFPAPIPAQNGVVAVDVAIGRVMRAKDWAVLRDKVRPLMDELEGVKREDPKEQPAS
jgi:hypothetical protein